MVFLYLKNMETLLIPSNIMFALGIFGVVFSIYRYFKDPQVSNEKKDALLRQEVQWTKEGNDIRFAELQNSFKDLLLQSNNHIHTVDVKVDKVVETTARLSNEVTKLATIIEERIPRK